MITPVQRRRNRLVFDRVQLFVLLAVAFSAGLGLGGWLFSSTSTREVPAGPPPIVTVTAP